MGVATVATLKKPVNMRVCGFFQPLPEALPVTLFCFWQRSLVAALPLLPY